MQLCFLYIGYKKHSYKQMKLKSKSIRESLSNDIMFINKLNLALSQFETEHPYKNGLGDNVNFSEQELVSLVGQVEKLKQFMKSGKKKEQLALEATILTTLNGNGEKSFSQPMRAREVNVPTVERRFNNIKSFNDMQQEAFVSPLTSFKTKAKNDIKSKVDSITTDKEEIKSEKTHKPTMPKGQSYKPDRRNINSLKSEISNKMKELDIVFKQDAQTVITKAEEVKQMLEKLNIMLVKEAHKPKAKMVKESKSKKSCGTGKCGNCRCKR
jgi:hypothetical protein